MRFFFIFYNLLLNLVFFSLALVIISSHLKAATFLEKQVEPVAQRLTDFTSLEIFLAGGLSTLLVRPSDDQIRSDWRDHQKMPEDQSKTGDLLGSGIPGILIAGSQYFFDSNENHFQSHARGLIYSTLVNSALKLAINRPRPNEKDRLSFPSGHAMTSFLTATTLTYAYGWKAGLIAYPLAVSVGLSRLADDAHWGSDVVGGAFLGVLMARACFYEFNEVGSAVDAPKSAAVENQLQLFPVFQPAGSGLGLVYTF